MLLPRFAVSLVMVSLTIFGAGSASGQNYPNKPIRIVTSGVGGGVDFAARLIAQGLLGPLNQQVIVDNRPTGTIPGDIVAKAQPDGYTLLFAGGSFAIEPLIQKTPYDPVRDFAPITLVSRSPNILVVHPSLPVNSVQELITYAKAKPGALNYAMTGAGGSQHLAAELFKSMAGVDIVRINYKSSGTAMADLLAGQVQLSFTTTAGVAPHIKSGKLRALAITAAQPSALAPGLPTIAASGLPGYESGSMYSLLAPAKTPPTIINRLNQEIVRVLNLPDVKQKFFSTGLEVVASTPELLAATMKSEIARLGKVIQDAGIKTD